MKNPPWPKPTMLISIGIESMVLVRDARNATRRAFAIWSAVASTSPSTFFWFGQMKTQTLNSMMVPSHAPTPINSAPAGAPSRKPNVNASAKRPTRSR